MLLLSLASCVRTPPAPPVAASQTAEDVACAFWERLGQRDNRGAAALATFPFDLDAHEGCLASAAELERAFDADPLPPGEALVVGGARRVDRASTDIAPHWVQHLARFAGDDAPCLDEAAVRADEVVYVLVDFTLNGEPIGALTRVRCRDGCRVAGVDN